MKGQDIGILALLGVGAYLLYKKSGSTTSGTDAGASGAIAQTPTVTPNYTVYNTKNTTSIVYNRGTDNSKLTSGTDPAGTAIAQGKVVYASVGGGTPLVYNSPTTTKGPGNTVYTPKRTVSEHNVVVVK